MFIWFGEAIERLPTAARHRKAEQARLNPQDVGAREGETLKSEHEQLGALATKKLTARPAESEHSGAEINQLI
ncbi:hypothetical protein AB986_06535 [Alkalihalobacillus macyae]|uniref:Uncharacterized protein n=1 Tax=Guptibacillus hwajinpoensis TaxID=208199 RepID=A0A0J6CRH4_9BACL|nr:hypothetical protein AB986_06535 [Alkalihalobacillus macyae]